MKLRNALVPLTTEPGSSQYHSKGEIHPSYITLHSLESSCLPSSLPSTPPSGSSFPIWASLPLCASPNAHQCLETIVPAWFLMLKGRRSILFSHTPATGLTNLCPSSTPRLTSMTASPDTLPFVPSTLDPSRLLRWLACPPNTLLINYAPWRHNTGTNQKRQTVQLVGPSNLIIIFALLKQIVVIPVPHGRGRPVHPLLSACFPPESRSAVASMYDPSGLGRRATEPSLNYVPRISLEVSSTFIYCIFSVLMRSG